MPHNKSNAKVFPLAIFSLFLAACGGSSDSNISNSPVTTEQPSAPIQLSARNWESSATSSTQARTAEPNINVAANSNSSNLYINASGLNDLSNKFWQIHIDSDNNPDTGYQFKYNAWSNVSGVDYIIQNGHIFKSTANDSSWSWQLLNESPVFSSDKFPTDGNLIFTISAYEKEICGTVNVGAIVLNQNWKIETFYPVANSLLKKTITFCETNRPPVITTAGTESIIVGDPWAESGATAIDPEDGDITSQMTINYRNLTTNMDVDVANIDTSVPATYLITYSVTDSDGKSASNLRNLYVNAPLSDRLTIDGDSSDWDDLSQVQITRDSAYLNGEIMIADGKDHLYILVKSRIMPSNVHWQVFIDSDTDINTGHRLQSGGADYLIENGRFSAFLGGLNQYQWSWDWNNGSVGIQLAYGEDSVYESRFVTYTAKVIEIAIPKENLLRLGNSVSLTYTTRDNNWKQSLSLPEPFGTLLTHTLSNP